MKKKSINWIFALIFIIGISVSLFFIITQTNLLNKNDDFKIKIIHQTKTEGDVGYIILKRNVNTPSVLDWATFDNDKTFIFFSEDNINKNVFIDLPEDLEKGTYYLDYEIIYMSDKKEIKTLSFNI